MEQQLLSTKVVYNNRIFLPVKDCAAALGIEDVEGFAERNRHILVDIPDIGVCMQEADFNELLLADRNILENLRHIEITSLHTLRASTQAAASMYPLKMAVAGTMYSEKAKKKAVSQYRNILPNMSFRKKKRNVWKNC